MSCANSALLLLMLLFETAFGQAGIPSFHVRGVITDQSGAVIPRATVTFQNKQLDKSVTTNERGVYETELPFGNYTMTAEVSGFRPYRRPLFRVASSETITFDLTLPVQSTCDLTVVSNDGGTPTPGDLKAAEKEFCLREDSFPTPSRDGVPYQVLIRYGNHNASGDTYSYTGEKAPNHDPVFVAYNLFSLQAETVVYDAKDRTLRATGNVVVADQSGVTQRAEYTAVKVENGSAVPIP